MNSSHVSSSTINGVLRRRNGRQQACEPCRRRKVSCDHALPACQRCRKAGKTGDCAYIVSKHTAQMVRDDSKSRASIPTPTGSPQDCVDEFDQASDRSPEPSGVASPGYLGVTSFSAVFEETRNSLSLINGAQFPVSNNIDRAVVGTATSISAKTLEQCVAVLRRLPSPTEGESLFLRHKNPCDGWIRLVARRMLKAFYDVFGQYLGEHRDLGRLADVARIICSNTTKYQVEDEPEADKWIASFSGVNTRWETLGILCSYWALGNRSNITHRPEPSDRVSGSNRVRGMVEFKDHASRCEVISRELSPHVSTLHLYLLEQISILESNTSGDASFAFWKLHSEVVALVTFLGLHVESNAVPYKVSACSEARRRIFTKIFVIDKVVASFTGRPPLIGRRYVSTPMPLDLSDEVLLSDRETLERAVRDLDEDGWDLKQEVHYSSTIVRARMQFAQIKDEIFEIALGHSCKATLGELLDLKEREMKLIDSIPKSMLYNQEDIRDRKVPPSMLYTRMLTLLEHLQNMFFAERLLIQKGHDGHADLLAVSFQMLELTLIFWMHMDRLAGLHGDFEWLVMAYAAPAGGILCMELLRPMLHLRPGDQSITRSKITQQLSLLIGFLDWVSPSAPNGDLCTSSKTIIQHVLDHSLNAASGPQPHEWDLSGDFGDFFNFDLLDTFDFLRPEGNGNHQWV